MSNQSKAMSSLTDSLPVTRKEHREMENRLMLTMQEMVVKVNNSTARLGKIENETRTLLNTATVLLDEIKNLKAQIGTGQVSQALVAAITAMETQVGVVDELVDDEPGYPYS